MTKVALRGLARAQAARASRPGSRSSSASRWSPARYVLTDTINKSFERDLQRVAARARTSRSRARQDVQTDDAAPPRVPGAPASTGCGRWTASRPPRAPSSPSAASWTRRATRSATASRPNFIASLPAEAASRRSTYVEGRPPRTRPRGLDRQADRRHAATSKIGGTLRLAGAHEAKTYQIVGLHEARRHQLRRRRHRPADCCPRRSGSPTRRASSTRSRSGRAGRRDARSELRDRIARVMPPPGAGRDRASRRPSARRSDIEDNLSSSASPARVRRRVAVRGRLPDLQHVLDHGRPAHARVRDAAHARRVARASSSRRVVLEALMLGVLGAALGAARRHRLRVRHQRAVQGGRHRPAEHRHGDRDPHGDRLADRRRGRDAGRGARRRRCGPRA